MNFSQIYFDYLSLKLYGVFLTIAFLWWGWAFWKSIQAREESMDFFVHHFWRWALSGFFFGFVLDKIFAFSELSEIQGFSNTIAFFTQSIALWGFVIGFYGLMAFELRRKKKSFIIWASCSLGEVFYALMIINFGAFLSGTMHGPETSLFWGVQYENANISLLLPLHPTPIYAIILYFFARLSFKKFISPVSRIIYVGLFLVLSDFFLQFFRSDSAVIIFGSTRFGHFLDGLVIFTVIIFLLWKSMKKQFHIFRKNPRR